MRQRKRKEGTTYLFFLLTHISDFSHNRFFGELPSDFFDSGFHKLHLGENQLTGKLPKILYFNNGIGFNYLNLSFNNFSGELPQIIELDRIDKM